MSLSYVLKFFIVCGLLLSSLPVSGQEEKFKAIGLGSLIAWGHVFPKASFEYKFSAHWSIQPEVLYLPECGLIPCAYVVYTFNEFQKHNVFPHLSFGGGGWISFKNEGGAMFIIDMRAGIKHFIIRNTKYGVAYKVVPSFSFIIKRIYLNIGVELCLF